VRGGAGEGVEQNADGEGEDALGDADGEPGRCFREVPFESHLAPFRLAKTLSITSPDEASARSRPMLAAVRVLSG